MADKHPFRDGTEGKFVCLTMSIVQLLSNVHETMSVFVGSVVDPFPTSIWTTAFVDMRPDSLTSRIVWVVVPTVLADEYHAGSYISTERQ